MRPMNDRVEEIPRDAVVRFGLITENEEPLMAFAVAAFGCVEGESDEVAGALHLEVFSNPSHVTS